MELGNLFKKMDVNNDGVLTIDEIKQSIFIHKLIRYIKHEFGLNKKLDDYHGEY